MNLYNLKPKSGSTHKNSKRLGRGEGSGKGGTSTRGHKGAKSRSGYSKKIGFEGGQMPLQRRVPKFGFNNFNRKIYSCVNLDSIQKIIDEKKITKSLTIQNLIDFGAVNKNHLIKVLGRGKINSSIKIEANKFSKSAEDSIKKAGGDIIIK
jgi:large subunit ribosomal protein L15